MLERDGFTLVGGLVRDPKKVASSDVDSFFVYSLPRAGKMVGYNLRECARNDAWWARLNRGVGAADRAFPKGWQGGPNALAKTLNDYRAAATGGGGVSPPRFTARPSISASAASWPDQPRWSWPDKPVFGRR